MNAFEWMSRLAVVCVLALGVPAMARAQMNPELGLEEDTGGGGSGSAEVSVTEGDDEAPPRADDDEGEEPAWKDAEAEEEPKDDGGKTNHIEAFRLGLAMKLFDYTTSSTTWTDNADNEQSRDSSVMGFGLFPTEVGLNLGMGFAGHFVLGARLQLKFNSGDRSTTLPNSAEGSTAGMSLSFLPYFEAVINPTDTVAWMAYATLGLRSMSLDLPGQELSQNQFVIGAGLGTHIFFTDGASIDPAFEFVYAAGGGTDTNTSLSPDRETDFTVSGLVLGLEIGMSLWL